MKGLTIGRVIIGGLVAGVALYYTIEATVYFIAHYTSIESPGYIPHWILLAFRLVPGIAFAFLYWRVGAVIRTKSWLTKGLIVGIAFSLLNETLLPSNLYDMISLGNYLGSIETVLSILFINVAVGYLIVSLIPVHPIGDKQ